MSDGTITPERIVAAPARFKATHVLAHLDWRLCLANSVERVAGRPLTSAERAQEEVLGVWRTKGKGKGEGTWYDTYIAGTAAYADFFISDDGGQRRRCEFLRQRHLVTFTSISLNEVLR
ncbi:hypothetical protein HPC49_20365 [Pyxidicoccus fallax]|uniref:Uncharacterized protein n=1 Tax=Pyxidicoccus fallax TaxID=394095 RepID=A0A848LPY2_9BACT|nr:hypothetical protein [Pyxidicoccus fallax]NMO19955.1 hypothetical protein [Pyxidicoccus fallax]NPC80567.1 hypothetical protein [Pyxidicoccus fallax]